MRPTIAEVLDTLISFFLSGFFVSLIAGDWNPYNWSGWFKLLWFVWFMFDVCVSKATWRKGQNNDE